MTSKLDPESKNIHWHGQGPTLVLLHGWGMNAAVWQQLTPLLVDAGFRVAEVNLPGFGGTKPLSSADDIELIAQQLWRQLPHQCHLLGWSLGGLVATQMALSAPSRTLSLCTVASSPCFQAQEGWYGIKPAILDSFADQLQQDIDTTIRGFFALQGMGSESARTDVRQLKLAVLSLPRAEKTALVGGLTMLKQVDLRQKVGDLAMPWLRIYGRNDALVPKASIAAVGKLAPRSQVVVIEGAGHAPFISDLTFFQTEVIQFYTEQ